MTTTRTFTCPTCGATLATSAEPGTTIKCEYCGTDFVVPAPSLDQPGDSQATVMANFRRRGNPSPMPPTAEDGTPPSTPERPPAPDSPAGVGYTVDSDAEQPMVGRGAVDEGAPPAAAPLATDPSPEPAPEPTPEPELRTPEIIEELDEPAAVTPTDPAAGATPEIEPEPEPPVPPAADPRASEMTMIAPRRVRAELGEAGEEAAAPEEAAPVAVPVEPTEPERLPVTEGASVADIIAEPTKYGAAIPSTQGEPVVMGPGDVRVMPPQTPVAGGPPGAAMRSGNRNMPMLIGGGLILVCCALTACAALVFVMLPLFGGLGG